MKTSLKTLACAAALAVLATVRCAPVQSRLQGAWKITEVRMSGPNAFTSTNPQPSLVIFTRKHFSIVADTSNKPRPDQPLEEATDSQKVAAWADFEAIAGTYEAGGTTFTVFPTVTKDPSGMKPGTALTFDFKIEGNTLLLALKVTHTGPLSNPLNMKLTRVE